MQVMRAKKLSNGPGDKKGIALKKSGNKHTTEKGHNTLGKKAAKAYDDAIKRGYPEDLAHKVGNKVQKGKSFNIALRQVFHNNKSDLVDKKSRAIAMKKGDRRAN